MIASKRLLLGAAFIAAASMPLVAHAQSADQTLAQSLFNQAMKLINAGNFKEACPKLAESQKLDPGGGTLINLAMCREREGKLASAWAAYNEALSYSIKDGRKERETSARERIAALEPQLATIRVVVPESAAVSGLEVTLDGAPLRQAAWGNPTPTDTGSHVVTANAPGKVSWKRAADISKNGETVSVTVPVLEDAPVTPVASNPNPTTAPPATEAPPQGKNTTAAWVVGGIGAAGIVAGTIAGILVFSERSQSDSECVGGCTQKGVDLMNEAQTTAWVSDVAIGVGVAALAVSIVLFVTAKPSKATTARVFPLVAPGATGLVGRF